MKPTSSLSSSSSIELSNHDLARIIVEDDELFTNLMQRVRSRHMITNFGASYLLKTELIDQMRNKVERSYPEKCCQIKNEHLTKRNPSFGKRMLLSLPSNAGKVLQTIFSTSSGDNAADVIGNRYTAHQDNISSYHLSSSIIRDVAAAANFDNNSGDGRSNTGSRVTMPFLQRTSSSTRRTVSFFEGLKTTTTDNEQTLSSRLEHVLFRSSSSLSWTHSHHQQQTNRQARQSPIHNEVKVLTSKRSFISSSIAFHCNRAKIWHSDEQRDDSNNNNKNKYETTIQNYKEKGKGNADKGNNQEPQQEDDCITIDFTASDDDSCEKRFIEPKGDGEDQSTTTSNDHGGDEISITNFDFTAWDRR